MHPENSKKQRVLLMLLSLVTILLGYNTYLAFSKINTDKAPIKETSPFPPHSYEPELMEFNSRPIISRDTSYNVQFAYGKRMHDIMGLHIFANGKQLVPSYDSIRGIIYPFSTKPTKVGEQSVFVETIFLNPHTHQMDTIQRTFYYTSGFSKRMVYLHKNKILYKGIENPVILTHFGIGPSSLSFSVSGCKSNIKKAGKNLFYVHALDTGHLTLLHRKVHRNPQRKVDSFRYKVVELPNPIARINGKQSGVISSVKFKRYKQLTLDLESVETDSVCKLQSYKLIHTPNLEKPQIIKGSSLEFKGKVLKAIQAAYPKDQYHFIDIMVLCPGDTKARRISSLVFMVK
ncbi:MAG: hypothetical protein GY810_31560 [Aureispira sp.]|nr:hypothetical protein [Aureispira sp.]